MASAAKLFSVFNMCTVEVLGGGIACHSKWSGGRPMSLVRYVACLASVVQVSQAMNKV